MSPHQTKSVCTAKAANSKSHPWNKNKTLANIYLIWDKYPMYEELIQFSSLKTIWLNIGQRNRFFQRWHMMAKKHIKRCSAHYHQGNTRQSSSERHLTTGKVLPTRRGDARRWGCREESALCTLRGNVNCVVTTEKSTAFPQKVKHRTAAGSNEATSGHRTAAGSNEATSGYVQKGSENRVSKKRLHPHVHCSITDNSQDNRAT